MSTGYTKKKCHILFFKLIWWHFKKLQREHYLCPCMLKLAGTPRLHCNNMINIFHVYRRNLFQMCPILKKNGILYFPDNLILKANSCFEYKNTFNEKKRLCTTMGGSHAPKKKTRKFNIWLGTGLWTDFCYSSSYFLVLDLNIIIFFL